MQLEYRQRELLLKQHLENALVARVAALTEQASRDIVSESAALQESLDGAAATQRSRYEAGLAAAEQAMQLHEAGLAAHQRDELQLAVRARQAVYDEYAEIRDAQAAIQWQSWEQHAQLQQWHGAETRQMESEVALASSREASAEASVVRLQAQHRSDIMNLEQRC